MKEKGPFIFFTAKNMGKTVGLTYNLKNEYVFKKGDPLDANAEFDTEKIVSEITQALESGGHKIEKIGNVQALMARLPNPGVDIVFNICEGTGGRNRESQMPNILEMMEIPYVGSDALTLGLTLDKILTKKILIADGIPTPKFFEAKDSRAFDLDHLKFPLIIKPRSEGTSKGISDDAFITDEPRLRKRIDFIVSTYKQPALVEEFITGREFTVAIIGNENLEVFDPVQIEIDGKTDLGNLFYTFARVSSDRLRYVFPPKIDKRLSERIKDVALSTYRAVECRDFGRVDVRVDENDNPYVLEINPLPSLSTEDVFKIIPEKLGSSYAHIINQILNFALERYGISEGATYGMK